jgi:hypothetical protein
MSKKDFKNNPALKFISEQKGNFENITKESTSDYSGEFFDRRASTSQAFERQALEMEKQDTYNTHNTYDTDNTQYTGDVYNVYSGGNSSYDVARPGHEETKDVLDSNESDNYTHNTGYTHNTDNTQYTHNTDNTQHTDDEYNVYSGGNSSHDGARPGHEETKDVLDSNESDNYTHNTGYAYNTDDTQYTHNTQYTGYTDNTYELKNQRLNLLLKPTVLKNLKKIAHIKRTSVNSLINNIAENYILSEAKIVKLYDELYQEN